MFALCRGPSHGSGDLPAAHFATSPEFYANNFHELIFKGLRRLLGEDADSVEVPVEFGSYWVELKSPAFLLAQPEENAKAMARLPEHRRVLVVSPQADEDWVRVYDPVSHRQGYTAYAAVVEVGDPPGEADDETLERLEDEPENWPSVEKANAWIRGTAWGAFALFGLVAAWKTTNFDRFLVWAPAALIASYFCIMTQLWPWYLMWALALGAFCPGKLPAKMAVLLSCSVLSLYCTIGFAQSSEKGWIYTYRSIPAIVLPTALFAVAYRRRLFGRWARVPAVQMTVCQ